MQLLVAVNGRRQSFAAMTERPVIGRVVMPAAMVWPAINASYLCEWIQKASAAVLFGTSAEA